MKRRGAPSPGKPGGKLTATGERRNHARVNNVPSNVPSSMQARVAKFGIGQVVRHRFHPFRGVIYNVDPEFANTEEWWRSIPEEARPIKNQPFYHLYAENADSQYVAYVSEQNLLPDKSGEPVRHPQVEELFVRCENGDYRMRGKWMAS
jgi:heat shock protein HspQ